MTLGRRQRRLSSRTKGGRRRRSIPDLIVNSSLSVCETREQGRERKRERRGAFLRKTLCIPAEREENREAVLADGVSKAFVQ